MTTDSVHGHHHTGFSVFITQTRDCRPLHTQIARCNFHQKPGFLPVWWRGGLCDRVRSHGTSCINQQLYIPRIWVGRHDGPGSSVIPCATHTPHACVRQAAGWPRLIETHASAIGTGTSSIHPLAERRSSRRPNQTSELARCRCLVCEGVWLTQ